MRFSFKYKILLGIGDWGLGIGDWGGLGIGPNPQSPNPQSPIPNPQIFILFIFYSIKKIYKI